MPCMCGDPYCPSCGPAQGNHRCLVCGRWTLDGSCKNKKKCRAENERLAKLEYEALDAEYRAEQEYEAAQRAEVQQKS